MCELHGTLDVYAERVRRGIEGGDPVDVAQGIAGLLAGPDDRVFLRVALKKKHMEEIKAIVHYVGISVSGWARNRLLMAARREERERAARTPPLLDGNTASSKK